MIDIEGQKENIDEWISYAELLCNSRDDNVTTKMLDHHKNKPVLPDNVLFSGSFFEGNLHARVFTKQFLITGLLFIEPESSQQFIALKKTVNRFSPNKSGFLALLQALDNNDLLSIDPFPVANLMLDILNLLSSLNKELVENNDYYLEIMNRIEFTLGYCDFCQKLKTNPNYKKSE